MKQVKLCRTIKSLPPVLVEKNAESPTELMWDKLDGKVRAKQVTNVTHLWPLLQHSSLPSVLGEKNAENL